MEEERLVSTVSLDIEEGLDSESLLVVEDASDSEEADFCVLDFSAELVCLMELLTAVADDSLVSLLADIISFLLC